MTLFDFLSLKNDVNVASKSNKQIKLCKKISFLLASWRSMTKIAGSHRSEAWIRGSGSTPKFRGSATLPGRRIPTGRAVPVLSYRCAHRLPVRAAETDSWKKPESKSFCCIASWNQHHYSGIRKQFKTCMKNLHRLVNCLNLGLFFLIWAGRRILQCLCMSISLTRLNYLSPTSLSTMYINGPSFKF